MKSLIIHADGRRTDLSGGVGPDTYAELETGRYSRSSPSLWCGACGGSIYIRHGSTRTDELFGAHHNAGDCAADLTIRKSRMTDEHKRQAEYHAAAAEQCGYTASLEVPTTGHTRVDVVVNGRIGFEIQRSALKKASAIDRTARSVAAGLTAVAWFTDRDSHPQWLGHVPGYHTTMPPEYWRQMRPEMRTVNAAGLRIIEAVRCGTRALCTHQPRQIRRPCSLFIPWPGAWTGIVVDDVVEGLAAGHIRPVRMGKRVELLSTASIGLYEELTGIRLSYNPSAAKALLWPSAPEECDRLLSVPADAPAPVRAWFEAELARVQQAREECQQAERDRLAQAEQTERRRAAHEAGQAKYWDMQRKARQVREGTPHAQHGFATIDDFLTNSQLCVSPGCRSGPKGQPGRSMDPSGLCYVCRTGR